ncbi:MAG: complex I NDUFA9 subunit family protein [Alphaproteobacteria bacterium]|nr:complex I NDUFA9 subunit family protein [Alphaproteobacteria bacterium]
MGKITVVGGAGFLGRYLIRGLARQGLQVRAAVRDPEAAGYLKPMGEVGQVQPIQANIRDAASIARAVAGADMVVNLTGVMFPGGAQSFQAVHVDGAATVARAAHDAGAVRLIHVSAIGAEMDADSKYARSKAAGEAAVRDAFPTATIVRPSTMFGPEDKFFNLFARIATILPVMPLLGGGHSRMQPVYVGDVARAIAALLRDEAPTGGIYELGGPQVLNLAELMAMVCALTGRKRLQVPLPFALAKFEAFFLQILPWHILTMDQVELLKVDNIISGDHPGLAELGVTATTLDAILPSYLYRYRKAGRLPSIEQA